MDTSRELVRDELDRITDGLVEEFPALSREVISGVVDGCYDRLAERAKIDTFLPMLAGRQARDELKARAVEPRLPS